MNMRLLMMILLFLIPSGIFAADEVDKITYRDNEECEMYTLYSSDGSQTRCIYEKGAEAFNCQIHRNRFGSSSPQYRIFSKPEELNQEDSEEMFHRLKEAFTESDVKPAKR